VQALLDAGVSANGGAGLNDSPLYFAVISGCGAKGCETDALVSTVGMLLKGGADVKCKDDNGNTIMTSAAQMCGGKIVGSLTAAQATMVSAMVTDPREKALLQRATRK